MRFRKITALALTSLLVSGATYAANPGVYVGGGVGYSQLEDFEEAKNKDNGNVGGGVFAGYNFNKYFGVEAGYRAYGEEKYRAGSYNMFSIDYKFRAFSLVGKAYLPLGNDSSFNLYGLLGAAYAHGEGDLKYNSPFGGSYKVDSSSNNALVATVGAGMLYDINANVSVGAEYTFTGGKDGDDRIGIPQSNAVFATLAYNFGY